MHELSLLVFSGLNYKFEPEVCNGCHDVSMIAYELQNIAILNVKGVIWNMTINVAVYKLNSSKLDDKGSL